MFYQNNNDYMRDAFFYSQPQSNTYQYNGMNNYMPVQNSMPNSNMYSQINPFNNMNSSSCQNSLENMYPQVYRVVDPVARRVITNNPYQCYTEDNINNMVDTVYNIVEGDVSSLSSTMQASGDDTVSQGPARSTTTSTSNTNNRQTTIEPTRTVTTTTQNIDNDNRLLKDLIKIIIIKELLSRRNSYSGMNSMNNMNMNNMNSMPQNGYYGMI